MAAKTPPAAPTDSAGVAALGEAQNKMTLATMAISITQQGEAARTNLIGEGAKAAATIHD